MSLLITFSFAPLTTLGMVALSCFLTTIPPLPFGSGWRPQHRNCCAGSEQTQKKLLPWVSRLAPSPRGNAQQPRVGLGASSQDDSGAARVAGRVSALCAQGSSWMERSQTSPSVPAEGAGPVGPRDSGGKVQHPSSIPPASIQHPPGNAGRARLPVSSSAWQRQNQLLSHRLLQNSPGTAKTPCPFPVPSADLAHSIWPPTCLARQHCLPPVMEKCPKEQGSPRFSCFPGAPRDREV